MAPRKTADKAQCIEVKWEVNQGQCKEGLAQYLAKFQFQAENNAVTPGNVKQGSEGLWSL